MLWGGWRWRFSKNPGNPTGLRGWPPDDVARDECGPVCYAPPCLRTKKSASDKGLQRWAFLPRRPPPLPSSATHRQPPLPEGAQPGRGAASWIVAAMSAVVAAAAAAAVPLCILHALPPASRPTRTTDPPRSGPSLPPKAPAPSSTPQTPACPTTAAPVAAVPIANA